MKRICCFLYALVFMTTANLLAMDYGNCFNDDYVMRENLRYLSLSFDEKNNVVLVYFDVRNPDVLLECKVLCDEYKNPKSSQRRETRKIDLNWDNFVTSISPCVNNDEIDGKTIVAISPDENLLVIAIRLRESEGRWKYYLWNRIKNVSMLIDACGIFLCVFSLDSKFFYYQNLAKVLIINNLLDSVTCLPIGKSLVPIFSEDKKKCNVNVDAIRAGFGCFCIDGNVVCAISPQGDVLRVELDESGNASTLCYRQGERYLEYIEPWKRNDCCASCLSVATFNSDGTRFAWVDILGHIRVY